MPDILGTSQVFSECLTVVTGDKYWAVDSPERVCSGWTCALYISTNSLHTQPSSLDMGQPEHITGLPYASTQDRIWNI